MLTVNPAHQKTQHPPHLVILLNNLEGGGMQCNTLRLIRELQTLNHANLHHLKITLVLAQAQGECLPDVPSGVNLIDLGIAYGFRAKTLGKLLIPLKNCLQQQQPTVILSRLPCFNFLAVLAWQWAGKPGRIILGEHTLPLGRLMATEGKKPGLVGTLSQSLAQWLYPQADGVVAASTGIARELQKTLGLDPDRLQVIYNPVVNEALKIQAQQPLDHPWFQPGEPPVFLAVGRLAAQKDYGTLIRAFAQVQPHYPSRLLILGEGSDRPLLTALIQSLALENVVSLPGFTANPYAYMTHAQALVLSSTWEILPTVLIEALACGCPVIATRCDYGPQEILSSGEYGWLVPVGDVAALAQAMIEILQTKNGGSSGLALGAALNPQVLQRRAEDFSMARSTQAYSKILGLMP
jgi:glycosyltransferase involved in cell wall biosynthesis